MGMQQRTEKVAQPSMEDILASIRKIIAEEPAPLKSNGATRPVAPASATAQPGPPPAPHSAIPRPGAPPPPRPTASPSTASPKPAAPTRLSDVMRELAPAAVSVGSLTSTSFHDDLADLVEDNPDAETKPEIASPAGSVRLDLPKPAVMTEPVEERSSSTDQVDLGAVVPQISASMRTATPRPLPLAVGADMRTVDPARAQSAKHALAPAVDVPTPPVSEAEESGLDSTSAATDSSGDAVDAAQSALGALAMGLAAPAHVAVSHEASFGHDMAPVSGRRSLDDAIIDMLRPMVREWLDAHLPEMVETALRQELTASNKRHS
jgi:uncharacterized protein